MKDSTKKILLILGFSLLGCLVGYLLVKTQESQLLEPKYLEFWAKNNMSVPEPMGYLSAMIGFVFLFGGIPTGLIIYKYLVNRVVAKDKATSAWIFLAGIILFPIYTVIGAIIMLPVLIYQIVVFIKNS